MKILEIEEEPFHEIRFHSSGRRSTVRTCVLPFHKVIVDKLPEGVSSFIATADLQGREKKGKKRLIGEQVAEELALLSELGEIPEVSFVLLAGDLYDYPDCRKLGGTGDVTSVWNAFADKFPAVIGVHGNHDIVQEEELEANITILDGTAINHQGFNIGGVCGIIGRPDRNQRKSEDEFRKALTAVTGKKASIVLLHQGPDDPQNQQLGEPFIREVLENRGSGLLIFGHCHWSRPFITLGENQVLNTDCRLFLFTSKGQADNKGKR